MSFLAPAWLLVAAIAVGGVIALHLITTQRPPPAVLPTARFVPQGDARASSRAARPTDLLLLLLRCAALMLMGAAFAGPVSRSGGTSLARVIVADRSRGAMADVRDSALALLREGDALVLFDSSATIVTRGGADSLRAPEPAGARGVDEVARARGVEMTMRARGSLSAALVGARRAARDLAAGADSVELVIVSPLTAEEIDAASATTFAAWPGRARLVRTSAERPAPVAVTVVSDDADDALRPAAAALNARAAAGSARGAAPALVRVVRGAPSAADSAAARDGAALVIWPRIGPAAPAAQGLWAGNATVVAPLARLALPAGGRVAARWADGAGAASEWPLGRGCVRVVGVGIPATGDVALQPAFIAVARALAGPCAGVSTSAAAPDSVAKRFSRAGPAAPAQSLRSSDERAPLAPWLLAAAVLLLALELLARRAPAERAA